MALGRRKGYLTHAGVDHLLDVLRGVGVELNVGQQQRVRLALGLSENRDEEEALEDALDSITLGEPYRESL